MTYTIGFLLFVILVASMAYFGLAGGVVFALGAIAYAGFNAFDDSY